MKSWSGYELVTSKIWHAAGGCRRAEPTLDRVLG